MIEFPGRLLKVLTAALSILFCTGVHAAPSAPALFHEGQSLNRNVDWLDDASGKLTIEDVLHQESQSRFEPSHGKSSVGMTGDVYWLRVRIDPPAGNTGPLWLLLDPPYQDDLRLYLPTGETTGSGYRERLAGALVPFEDGRDLDFASPSFQLPPFARSDGHDTPMTIYLRLQTFQGTAFELSLWHEGPLRQHLQQSQTLLDLLYGIVIGLLFYNLFLAVSLRDATYFVYVAMVAASLLYIAHVNGDDFMYLWPDSPWIQIRCALPLGSFWACCAGVFALMFLGVPGNMPRTTKVIVGYILLMPVLNVLYFTGYPLFAAFVYYGSGLPWLALLYGAGIQRMRQGFIPARYALVGFSIVIAGVIVYFARLLGVFQPGMFSEHAIQVGTTFETLIFSLALAVRIRLLQHERDVALHDPLTGLLTRRLFDDRFAQACSLAQRQNAHVALMLIDLDKFKPINDQLGHDAGDAVLKAVAQRLLKTVRTTDSVSRFGGDEFAIVLCWPFDVDLPSVTGERILRAVQEPIVHRTHTLQVGLSIGVSFWPEHGKDFADLYKSADRALYRAKEAGRGRLYLAEVSPLEPDKDEAPSAQSAAAR